MNGLRTARDESRVTSQWTRRSLLTTMLRSVGRRRGDTPCDCRPGAAAPSTEKRSAFVVDHPLVVTTCPGNGFLYRPGFVHEGQSHRQTLPSAAPGVGAVVRHDPLGHRMAGVGPALTGRVPNRRSPQAPARIGRRRCPAAAPACSRPAAPAAFRTAPAPSSRPATALPPPASSSSSSPASRSSS